MGKKRKSSKEARDWGRVNIWMRDDVCKPISKKETKYLDAQGKRFYGTQNRKYAKGRSLTQTG